MHHIVQIRKIVIVQYFKFFTCEQGKKLIAKRRTRV